MGKGGGGGGSDCVESDSAREVKRRNGIEKLGGMLFILCSS